MCLFCLGAWIINVDDTCGELTGGDKGCEVRFIKVVCSVDSVVVGIVVITSVVVGTVVVVLNVEGMLKFVYRGNPSLPNGQFMPRDIATDIHGLIMTNDFCNHSVHIFDCDGNFLRFIQSPTGDGGLGFDADNNLVLGDKTGELYIIRYWE